MNQQKRTLVELKLSWAINYNINICNYMEGFLKLYSDLYHVMITAQRTEIFQIVHALSKFNHKRFYHPHTHTHSEICSKSAKQFIVMLVQTRHTDMDNIQIYKNP